MVLVNDCGNGFHSLSLECVNERARALSHQMNQYHRSKFSWYEWYVKASMIKRKSKSKPRLSQVTVDIVIHDCLVLSVLSLGAVWRCSSLFIRARTMVFDRWLTWSMRWAMRKIPFAMFCLYLSFGIVELKQLSSALLASSFFIYTLS